MSTIKSSAEDLTLNADGSGNDIKFQSNGSEVASIDQAGTITATNFTGTGGNLTVKSDGTTPAIILRDSDNNIDGMFKALNSTVGMQTGPSGDWALLATNDAEISLYHNNAVKLATTATGVAVTGGVAIGGTGTANTLDDYEEGTWTAGFTGGTVSPTNDTGHYIRVGRLCHFSYYGSAMTISSASGSAVVTGLPFTTDNTSYHYSVGTVTHNNAMNECHAFHMDINATTLRFLIPAATTYRGWLDGSSKYLMLTGTYIIKEGS